VGFDPAGDRARTRAATGPSGTAAEATPTSITDPAWVKLSPARALHAKKTTLPLSHSSEAFRTLAIWISEAPPGSTASAPGEVAVNEVVLYKPR